MQCFVSDSLACALNDLPNVAVSLTRVSRVWLIFAFSSTSEFGTRSNYLMLNIVQRWCKHLTTLLVLMLDSIGENVWEVWCGVVRIPTTPNHTEALLGRLLLIAFFLRFLNGYFLKSAKSTVFIIDTLYSIVDRFCYLRIANRPST